LCEKEGVYGYLYGGKRYDIGEKLEWLRTNFELALEDGRLKGFS
jgi:UTP--glucose-1-phosphate uridylyltransferase